ncbi:MAG: PQQ-binding-like beta-propeller repeat protein [Pseudomonadota bacterium]
MAPLTLVLGALVGCAAEDPRLVGDRESFGRTASLADTSTENAARPISLPAQDSNASWTHPGGNRLHRIPHARFGTTAALQWSADIGAGDGRRQRINARPVVAGGRIFTVDAESRVSAISTAGATHWTRNLTPANEVAGQGGSAGLAFGDGTLFVNSGYGEVRALDPATGTELWTQDIDALGGASTTYFDGRLYVAARDSVGWAIDAETGRIDWQINGTPSNSGYVGGAGPAITDELAIFPFVSGELVVTFRRGGVQRWTATVLGSRAGVAYSGISDIAADPVVAGSSLYVANPAGRLAALSLGDGERRWTAQDGTLSTPVVVGGSVFFVSDQNELLRLDAATGTRIWGVPLPLFEETRARRQRTVFAHLGPVLAGGRLWLASSDGQLRAFDPASGRQTFATAIPGGAATAPVVAGDALYVVSKRGTLLSYR